MRKKTMMALALGLLPAALTGQERCARGRPMTGDVGIRSLTCVTDAGCGIWGDGRGAGLRHWFSVEPLVTSVSGAHAALRQGDVIVSVDGVSITSAEGGRLLANLPVGERVTLVVRRDGDEVEIETTPVAGCGPTSISVVRR